MGRNKQPFIPYERIFVTNHVKARLQNIPAVLSRLELGTIEAEILLGFTRGSINHFVKGTRFPHLQQYLRLGEFCEWDLSYDPNYMYAKKIYSPEELHRRIEVVRTQPNTITEKNYTLLTGAITCEAMKHCEYYCGVLYMVASYEEACGLDDRIILEA